MSSSKNFDSILSDYDFFETHATEADQDAAHYLPHFQRIEVTDRPIRLLDFGCGAGRFLDMLLSQVGWEPSQLQLSLVEPGEVGRLKAVERLQPFTGFPITHWASLPDDLTPSFDIILSNHVLYYVHPLKETLARLISSLAPQGQFLFAIANDDNPLIQIWDLAFGLIDEPIPYNKLTTVTEALTELTIPSISEQVTFQIQFSDSKENRMRMLRFLLNEHLERMPEGELLAFFDEFVEGEEVKIETMNTHLGIGKN